jgi:hypothetical protein
LQHRDHVSRLLPVLALSTGCFYTDPINQRPSIEISTRSSETVFRGMSVTLDAEANDPEGQIVKFTWRAYACTDATTPAGCDQMPYDGSDLPAFTFAVPVMRVDQPVDVTALRIVLEGIDDHGATAKPDSVLVIPIGDAPPMLEVGKSVRPSYVVNTAVTLFAKYSDPDDDVTLETIDWHVFTPAQSATFTLDDTGADPIDAQHLQKAKKFVPMAPGSWDVQVTVTDPTGTPVVAHIDVDVDADAPPCIATYQPTAPLDLASPPLPLDTAKLFSISRVADDLDPYPTDPSDPVLGTTTFSWSLLGPGATAFAPLGVTGNGVVLDPGAYTVGDELELRVDITDRTDTQLTCPDSDLTCAVVAGSSCIQRLTWRVEVR